MSNLSKQHFIECLSTKEGFKNIKQYLSEIDKENEDVQEILSEGLSQILSTTKHPPLSKLHALRVFKDVFEMADFDCIDNLNEKVENAIYRLAGYKKQSKDQLRGRTYFIQVEKRPDTEENKGFGVNCHLFALECIKYFAEWYPIDIDGQISRFKKYYEALIKDGVVFPEKVHFFKLTSDREKFKNNYRKWLKRVEQRQSDAGHDDLALPKQSQINQQPSKLLQAPSRIPEPPKQVEQPPKQISEIPKDVKEEDIRQKGSAQAPRRQEPPPSKISEPPPSKIPAPPVREPPNKLDTGSIQQGKNIVSQISPIRQIQQDTHPIIKSQHNQKLKNQLEISIVNLEKLRTDLQQENLKLKSDINQHSRQYEIKLETSKRQVDELKSRLKEKEKEKDTNDKSKITANSVMEEKIGKLQVQAANSASGLSNRDMTIKMNDQRIRQLEEQLKKKEANEKDLKSKLIENSGNIQKPNGPKGNDSTLQKQLQHYQQLQEELAVNQSLVEMAQQEKTTSDQKIRSLQAENSRLTEKYAELERKLHASLQRQKYADKELIMTPIKLEVPREETNVNNHQNPTRILLRNELYIDVQPEKRGYSMPRTEKYVDSTQTRFYYPGQKKNIIKPHNMKSTENNFDTEEKLYRTAKLSEVINMRAKNHNITTDQISNQKAPATNRLSIFGLRDIDGTEIAFNSRLFPGPSSNVQLFRRTCLSQQAVFYQTDSLRIKLTKLGGTSEFNLLITNKASKSTEIQFEINQAEDYKITKVQFKACATIPPMGDLSENFIVKPNSLMYRYPVCKVGTPERALIVDLPITMLSFCKFLKVETSLDKLFFSRKTIKSECISVDSNVIELGQYFSRFIAVNTSDRLQGICTVTVAFNRDIVLVLRIVSFKNKCVFQVTHEASSEVSDKFAHMLLQVLMFCWRTEDHSKNIAY